MKHPDITQWADSVRGLSSAADRLPMARHLETGCRRCTSIVSALERVGRLARTDTEPAPLAHAVRSAKAYFTLNQPTRRSWLSEVALGLSFDSALHGAVVNTRADDASPRQLTFGSEEYTLDLVVDPADGRGEVGVAGYCLRREGDPVARAPVFLICRGRFAGRSTTGELGEFQFEGELVDPMELWLFDENDLPVAVNLDLKQAA